MSRKSLSILVFCAMTWFLCGAVLAQAGNIPDENSNYNVNREYDEHGNLLRYDSTVTYTWKLGNGNILFDSTFQERGFSFVPSDTLNDYGPNNETIFNFSFPGHDFFLDPDFMAPNIGDFFDNNNQHPDKSGNDTTNTTRPSNPQLHFHFNWPGMNESFNHQLKQMEEMMRQMQEDHNNFFRGMDDWHFNTQPPVFEVPDSTKNKIKQAKPAPIIKEENILHI